MFLQFPLVKIKPKSDLVDKFKLFDEEAFIERIFGTFVIQNETKEEIFKSKIIFDTGAVITLLPGAILKHLGDIKTVPHTMWGIIEKEECRIIVDLCRVSIHLIDTFGKTSSPINIMVGFSREPNTPALLGMKGLLATHDYQFDHKKNIFSIEL